MLVDLQFSCLLVLLFAACVGKDVAKWAGVVVLFCLLRVGALLLIVCVVVRGAGCCCCCVVGLVLLMM